jgi:hypothetical protein
MQNGVHLVRTAGRVLRVAVGAARLTAAGLEFGMEAVAGIVRRQKTIQELTEQAEATVRLARAARATARASVVGRSRSAQATAKAAADTAEAAIDTAQTAVKAAEHAMAAQVAANELDSRTSTPRG